MGRRLRAERRRINALKARREPLDHWGHHPAVALIPFAAKQIREEKGLSLSAAAELADMKPSGVDKFEKSKAGGTSHVLGKLSRGYLMKPSAFMRRAEKEYILRSRRARSGPA